MALGESAAADDVTGEAAAELAAELAAGLATTVGCDARGDETWLAVARWEVEHAPRSKVTARAAGTYTRRRNRNEDTLHLRASCASCSPIRRVRRLD